MFGILLRTGASQAATFALPATIESVLCVDGYDGNNDVDVDADVARVLPVRRKTPTSDISKKSVTTTRNKNVLLKKRLEIKKDLEIFLTHKKNSVREKNFPPKMFFGKALVVCFAAFQFQSQLFVVESGPVDADVNVEQYWDLVSQVSPWFSVAVVAAEVVRQRATNREIPGLIPVGTCAFFLFSPLSYQNCVL